MTKKEKTQEIEKRGPILKTPQGWPINPYGILAIIVIFFIALFFLFSALQGRFNREEKVTVEPDFIGDRTPPSGRLIFPQSGDVLRGSNVKLTAQASDQDSGISAVEFWVSDHITENWRRLTRDEVAPYEYNWNISKEGIKAVILTIHIYDKAGNLARDPDGWHEGVVLIPN